MGALRNVRTVRGAAGAPPREGWLGLCLELRQTIRRGRASASAAVGPPPPLESAHLLGNAKAVLPDLSRGSATPFAMYIRSN